MPTSEGAAQGGVISFRCLPQFRDGSDVVVTQTAANGFSVEPGVPGGGFASFVAPSTNNYFVRIANILAAGTVRMVLLETTLEASWYFISAAASYEAFLEIRNNTSNSISVTVTPFASGGTSAGTPFTTTIAANGNTAVAVGAQFGITSGSGSVQIANTAPPGGVVANVTTLSGATGLSFDSPASPRMVWANFP